MTDKRLDDLHIRIRDLRDDLQAYAEVSEDNKLAALCETAGETIGGIEEAFDHYLYKSEPVWRL